MTTQAKQIEGLLPESTFVFRPSGVPGPGVYTTEASLSAAMAGVLSPELIIDLSFTGSTHYTFTTVGQLDLGVDTTWIDIAGGTAMIFADGTTLAHAPGKTLGILALATSQPESVCLVTSPFTTVTLRGNCSLQQVNPGETFLDVQSGAFLYMWMGDTAFTLLNGVSTSGLINVETGGICLLNCNDSAFLGANTVTPVQNGVTGTVILGPTGPAVDIDVSLYGIVGVFGLFNDLTGTGVTGNPNFIRPRYPGVLQLSAGVLWQSSGTQWIPVTTQSGRTTLVNGVSPVISVPFMNAQSRIVCTYAALNASAGLGVLAALETDRVNSTPYGPSLPGAPGSFKITSLVPATLATQLLDQSDVEWHVVQDTA